jgi:hypothetical protein
MKYLAIYAGGIPRKAQVKLGYSFSHQFIPLFDSHAQCDTWWTRYAIACDEEPAWAITTLGNVFEGKPSILEDFQKTEKRGI